MRLKFLFFPIIIIISVSIFAGYIWPEIKEVKQANEIKRGHSETLQAISEKKAAIQKVDQQISSNSEGEATINSYLPNKKVEERILTSVNYLATDSGVTLANIDISGDKTVAKKDVNDQEIVTASPLVNLAMGQAAGQSADKEAKNANKEFQTISAEISLSGEYDKIRLFLSQLQTISMFNTIKSVTIEPQDNESKTEDGQEIVSSVLSANVSMDFGWMEAVKIDNSKISSFKSDLDNETINAVKQYISQKTSSVEKFGNADGKRNPFLK